MDIQETSQTFLPYASRPFRHQNGATPLPLNFFLPFFVFGGAHLHFSHLQYFCGRPNLSDLFAIIGAFVIICANPSHPLSPALEFSSMPLFMAAFSNCHFFGPNKFCTDNSRAKKCAEHNLKLHLFAVVVRSAKFDLKMERLKDGVAHGVKRPPSVQS